jgi:hypothetical protein
MSNSLKIVTEIVDYHTNFLKILILSLFAAAKETKIKKVWRYLASKRNPSKTKRQSENTRDKIDIDFFLTPKNWLIFYKNSPRLAQLTAVSLDGHILTMGV